MHRTRPLAAAVLAVGALALPASIRADEPQEWEREAGPEVFYVSPEDANGQTHLVVRIVDDWTGAPIPGATVALHAQTNFQVTGLVAPFRTGVADDEGWVRIRANDLGSWPTWLHGMWKYVEAPGHAGGAADDDERGGEIRLQPARSAVVQVRDALNRPVAGAVVGVRVSSTCGHMPDQRVVVTDREGLAVVADLCSGYTQHVNAGWEAWTVADEIESDYHEIDVPSRSKPPQVLRHAPSHVVEGTILDAEGKPSVGVHVGGGASHRGPWATTDADGQFRLVGAPFSSPVSVVVEYEGMYAASAPPAPKFTAPPAGIRRVFRLPPTGTAEVEPKMVRVTIDARDATTGEALRDAPIVAVRDGDGWTARERGEIAVLPSGSFTVTAGGGVSPYTLASARIEVKEKSPPDLFLDLARHPSVRVLLEDDPTNATVTLVSATDERAVQAEVVAGQVPVPPGVECAFRVQTKEPERTVFVPIPLDRGGPDAPPVRIPAIAAVVIRARLAGPDGKEVSGWLLGDLDRYVDSNEYEDWKPETPAESEPGASVFAEGSVELLLVPDGRVLAPQVVRVVIPDGTAGGATVDGGVIRLEPRGDRRLFIQGAEGRRPDDAEIRISRGGVVRRWIPPEVWIVDANTRAKDLVCDPLLLPLAPGDEVEVKARWEETDRFERTIRRRLEGPGPWTIRGEKSRGSIAVEATDEAGEPMRVVVVIDGKAYEEPRWTAEGEGRIPVEVTGVDPGPHQVAVCAANRLTRIYRVVLKDGERRVLTPRLNRAPPLPAAK